MRSFQTIVRNGRTLLRSSTTSTTSVRAAAPKGIHQTLRPQTLTLTPRTFSTRPYLSKGIQPDTSDPVPPNPEPSGFAAAANTQPAPISDSEYHDLSEQYIDNLQRALEERAEDASNGIELEYAAGVLNITTPQGVYVINKQPPNKQLWLSSPISGPKRYDWVITGEGQNTKEGTETEMGDDGALSGGKWVCLRDGSALSDLLKDEIDVDFGVGVAAAAAAEGETGA